MASAKPITRLSKHLSKIDYTIAGDLAACQGDLASLKVPLKVLPSYQSTSEILKDLNMLAQVEFLLGNIDGYLSDNQIDDKGWDEYHQAACDLIGLVQNSVYEKAKPEWGY